MEEVQPNTAMIFVPPRFAADSILEAAAAGVELVIAITEGIPAHDELRVYNTLKRDHPGTRLVGPNCPGILSPGKANVGIIPASFFKQGNVGVVSRSGTLTYQIGNEIAQAGFGCSSIVGIGGDPVPGSSFVDILELFQADEQTELIVLSGEIGGSAEEEAADYIAEHMTKPVVAYIAGFTAPAGKQMGHAGAIVSGSRRNRRRQGARRSKRGRARRAHPHRGRRDRRRGPRRRSVSAVLSTRRRQVRRGRCRYAWPRWTRSVAQHARRARAEDRRARAHADAIAAASSREAAGTPPPAARGPAGARAARAHRAGGRIVDEARRAPRDVAPASAHPPAPAERHARRAGPRARPAGAASRDRRPPPPASQAAPPGPAELLRFRERLERAAARARPTTTTSCSGA